jgi:hypothetical protein
MGELGVRIAGQVGLGQSLVAVLLAHGGRIMKVLHAHILPQVPAPAPAAPAAASVDS